jgi:hypothetical protein
MYDSTAFILGALLSAGVAHYASLRLEYFLTIPFTCCAFFTLRRFREPTLHRKAPEPKLSGHIGQDAMPSSIRAGSSAVVSTIGYSVFIPAALGFGLTARSHSIFEASAFVAGALIVMCATLSMIVVKRQ